MRKSFHTLSGIITDAMGQDPCNGNVYIFINRDRIKLLHWEPGGMVQYSKLLEAGTLGKSDSASDNEVCANIEWRELVMIVEGIMEACDSRRTRLENLQKLRHYKIFCVNAKYGIQYGFRIFYLIALQNEENYEREESCSA